MPQRDQRFGDAGQNLQILRLADAILLDIQGTVAVEKHRRTQAAGLADVDLAGLPVGLDLLEPLWRSHVARVFARAIGEYAGAGGKQARQESLVKSRLFPASEPRSQRFAPHRIERGVDQIGKIAVWRMRIGVDCGQPSVIGDFQQIGIQRMIVGVSETGEVGFAVEVELRHSRQIDGRHHVAVENEEVLRQGVEMLHQRTGAAQRLSLHKDLCLDAEGRTVADKIGDLSAQMAGENGYRSNAASRRQFELMGENRLAADRDQSLRQAGKQFPEPLRLCRRR